MTRRIVEVGPGTVRGPCEAAPELVATALECIEDDIALVDDQPVAVAALWREVFRSVLTDGRDGTVLVCPTWWPQPWIDRVRDAAAIGSTNTVVLQRSQVLAEDVPGVPTVVEIAAEFVVIARAGRVIAAEPRIGGPADIARSVAEGVGRVTAAVLDAPVGVDNAVELARAIAECLRGDGVAVTTAHPDRVLAPVRGEAVRPVDLPARGSGGLVLGAVVVTVALVCVGLGVKFGMTGSEAPAVPMTLLVEGRLAVQIPAQWTTQRVTAGPGSARVQVTAPDNMTVIHVTQARVRKGEMLSATAAALRRALDDEETGVFSEFNPDDRRADRPAATYREVRGQRRIEWAVFVDDSLRIAIGCQSAGDEHAARDVCEQAIRSARAIV